MLSNRSLLCSSLNNINIFDKTYNVSVVGYVQPIKLFDCLTCKLALKSNAELKYHRMFHLSPERYACPNIDIINFFIKKDKTRFMHCSICDTIIHGEKDLEKHVKDSYHQKWIIFLQFSKLSVSNDLIEHTTNLSIDYNGTETVVLNKNLYCQLCALSIPYSRRIERKFAIHENGKRHRKKLMSSLINSKNFELTSISDDCIPVYVCFICNVEFTEANLLYTHYNNEIHQYRAKVLYALTSDKNIVISEIAKKEVLQCKMCNIETTDLQNILMHIFQSKHKNKIKGNASSSII